MSKRKKPPAPRWVAPEPLWDPNTNEFIINPEKPPAHELKRRRAKWAEIIADLRARKKQPRVNGTWNPERDKALAAVRAWERKEDEEDELLESGSGVLWEVSGRTKLEACDLNIVIPVEGGARFTRIILSIAGSERFKRKVSRLLSRSTHGGARRKSDPERDRWICERMDGLAVALTSVRARARVVHEEMTSEQRISARHIERIYRLRR